MYFIVSKFKGVKKCYIIYNCPIKDTFIDAYTFSCKEQKTLYKKIVIVDT